MKKQDLFFPGKKTFRKTGNWDFFRKQTHLIGKKSSSFRMEDPANTDEAINALILSGENNFDAEMDYLQAGQVQSVPSGDLGCCLLSGGSKW